MLKKTITYEDFNGVKHTEDFYFNISKAELTMMEIGDGTKSYGDHLKAIIASENVGQLISEFRNIILVAYGVKSEDGKRHDKSPQLRQQFENHAAFQELFMELATNTDEAVKFCIGVMPSDLQGAMETEKTKILGEAAAAIAQPTLPPPPPAV